MKKAVILSIISLSLILTACNSNEESETTSVKNGKRIDDIHGVGVMDNGTTYFATHEGLFSTKDMGKTWNKVGASNDDFMGFHLRSDGTMITSGHPGANSEFPNPLGILMSKDKGLNWKKVEYVGEIDFHLLTTAHDDQNIIYGLNQMGTGKYGAGIYKSIDGAKTWKKVEPKGLPDDLMKVYSLLPLPNNTLLAGTEKGVMITKDGGENWGIYDNRRLITAMVVMPKSKDILAYSISNGESGILISQDAGQTWKRLGLDLGKDAASSISVNQKDEKQIAVSTYSTSLYVTKDGGQNWNQIITSGKLK
jgi:photosystem II stability/assembly factor-like uncharacterized protein